MIAWGKDFLHFPKTGRRNRSLHHCGTQPMETARLSLRRFSVKDSGAMYRNWASNPNVTKYLIWKAHHEVNETEQVLKNWERQYRYKNFYEWAIVLKGTEEPIGSIGAVLDDKANGIFEAGYCIGEPWWKQGITTEALEAVIAFMFEKVGCNKIIAKYAAENTASGRVMEKVGMWKQLGDSVPVSTENGLYHCIVYEIDNPN